ncbi:hypothetical protein LEMLEM_LOCUS6354, partial [Lemmus lemmus]
LEGPFRLCRLECHPLCLCLSDFSALCCLNWPSPVIRSVTFLIRETSSS